MPAISGLNFGPGLRPIVAALGTVNIEIKMLLFGWAHKLPPLLHYVCSSSECVNALHILEQQVLWQRWVWLFTRGQKIRTRDLCAKPLPFFRWIIKKKQTPTTKTISEDLGLNYKELTLIKTLFFPRELVSSSKDRFDLSNCPKQVFPPICKRGSEDESATFEAENFLAQVFFNRCRKHSTLKLPRVRQKNSFLVIVLSTAQLDDVLVFLSWANSSFF